MPTFNSKMSWLLSAGLAAGLLAIGGNLTQAWQNTSGRSRGNANPDLDEGDREVEVYRDPNGKFITLSKCTVKLIDSVVLASDRPGVIAFVEPDEGEAVSAHQTVVGLRDEVAQALLKVAKQKADNDINKKFAVASADVAKAEWEKMKEANLQVPKSVPFTEVERARLNWVKGVLQGEQADQEQLVAKLEAEKAEAELQSMKIEAPFDGEIRRILKHQGEAVSQGTPVVELVSTRRVKVEGYVPVEDLGNVKKGDIVEVQVESPSGRKLDIASEIFQGVVTFVDPTVSPVTHGARVSAEVRNHNGRLIEGLYAKMKIKFTARTGTAKNLDGKIGPGGSNIRTTGGSK